MNEYQKPSSPTPILTVDENGQQTVKQGLQALMSRSDDLVEYNDQQISMSTFLKMDNESSGVNWMT